MSSTAIKAKDFSFTYKNASSACLNCLNFEIEAGTTTLVTGLSGSGKSTLLNCLCGLIPHVLEGTQSGFLEIFGTDVQQFEMHELARHVGVVFQNPRSQFFTTNTTSEIVFAQENYDYSIEEMKETLSEVAEEFNIEHLLNRDIHQLSMGEKQLIALASAKTLGQNIMLFDEPSSNLDYGNAMKLGKIIKKLNAAGTTCLVFDHRFFYLDGVISKVITLEHGAATSFSSQNEFLNSSYPYRKFCLFNLSEKELPSAKISHKPVLSLCGVSYKNILKDINLTINSGEIVCLIGNNGAGKTTLANICTGFYKPDSGSVSAGETPFYVAQDADYQLFGYSVENEFKLSSWNTSNQEIQETLTQLDLIKLKDSHPFSISGGEKQRLQIGLALTCKKDFLIFDEPTSGLDSKRMNIVSEAIKNLSNSAGILIITHDFEFIQNIATTIVYLHNGTIASSFAFDSTHAKYVEKIFKEMEEYYE